MNFYSCGLRGNMMTIRSVPKASKLAGYWQEYQIPALHHLLWPFKGMTVMEEQLAAAGNPEKSRGISYTV